MAEIHINTEGAVYDSAVLSLENLRAPQTGEFPQIVLDYLAAQPGYDAGDRLASWHNPVGAIPNYYDVIPKPSGAPLGIDYLPNPWTAPGTRDKFSVALLLNGEVVKCVTARTHPLAPFAGKNDVTPVTVVSSTAYQAMDRVRQTTDDNCDVIVEFSCPDGYQVWARYTSAQGVINQLVLDPALNDDLASGTNHALSTLAGVPVGDLEGVLPVQLVSYNPATKRYGTKTTVNVPIPTNAPGVAQLPPYPTVDPPSPLVLDITSGGAATITGRPANAFVSVLAIRPDGTREGPVSMPDDQFNIDYITSPVEIGETYTFQILAQSNDVGAWYYTSAPETVTYTGGLE